MTSEIVRAQEKTERTELFTAPHAEVAPFQRVWNPDTDNGHAIDEFAHDEDEGGEDDVKPDML